MPTQILIVKKLLLFLSFVVSINASAQVPQYYSNALGLNGQPLRVALYQIIKSHQSLGYSGLWSAYLQTDKKSNGKVWDIYSDRPGGTSAYEYNFGTDQCGSYNAEGDCYNREHTFPQSYFNKNEPMRSDLFIVYPTDGYVNGKRSDFPYGKVTSPTYTSSNGSKLGPNNATGAPSGTAFEPIDSFKGDLARSYFYLATRYYSEDNGWSNWEMANGAELKAWAIAMLLDWHHADPVSQKELMRNNAVYGLQQNRNPFIDYPQFADCIWGNADCKALAIPDMTALTTLSLFPNPATDKVTIDWSYDASSEPATLQLTNLQGQIYYSTTTAQKNITIATEQLPRGMYIIRIETSKEQRRGKLYLQ